MLFNFNFEVLCFRKIKNNVLFGFFITDKEKKILGLMTTKHHKGSADGNDLLKIVN